MEAHLAQIERVNPTVNAIVTLLLERAMAAARAADEALAHGAMVGPLHGLPITIKDALEVGGLRSTGGAIELTDHVPVADAPAGQVPFTDATIQEDAQFDAAFPYLRTPRPGAGM